MLTHKKRAQRSSRRRSRMALAADAHPPSVTSTQPFWPAGFLSSCGQLLPLPRVSRPACVPHHVYVLVRLPAVHGFEVHGCWSNDYAHCGSENMTGSAYYGWPTKRSHPQTCDGSIASPFAFRPYAPVALLTIRGRAFRPPCATSGQCLGSVLKAAK